MRAVETIAESLASGKSTSVDLSSFVHDRATHADLVPLSVLSWFLLSTTREASGWSLTVPPPGSSALRHLARAGVLAAAGARGMAVTHRSGELYSSASLHSDPARHQSRLPGVDWEVVDELVAADRLRVIPDLADPRRRVPAASASGLAYPWLATLGLASPSISAEGYKRFLADANAVLSELVDNVHRWSECSSAFAAVSVTRGGALDGDERNSWNRLHVVIADAGIGIPTALRRDLEALMAVYHSASGDLPLDELTDADLLERLLRHAFGDRSLPNHNGHGLNAAQIRASQWVGAFDVVTVGCDGKPFRRGSRGLDPEHLEGDDHALNLPATRGTLVHLMLQAVDTYAVRRVAASSEQLPFDGFDDPLAVLAGSISALTQS